MFRWLLQHRWKQFIRSRLAARSGFRLLLVTAAGLSLGAYLVIGAWLVPNVVREIRPTADPLHLVNRFLLTALAAWTGVRFFVQRPFHGVSTAYMHLPVDRTRLYRWMRCEAALSWMNALPLLFLTALAVRLSNDGMPSSALLFWWFLAVLGVLTSHYAAVMLRLALARNAVYGLAVVLAIMALAVLVLPLASARVQSVSQWFFHSPASPRWTPVMVLLAVVCSADFVTGRLLRRGAADEERGARRRVGTFFSLGDRITARLALQELQLLLRNKRPRQMLIALAPMLAFFAFQFAIGELPGTIATVLLVEVMMVAIGVNYGQFVFAWNGRYFDRLLTLPLSPSDLVRARRWVLQGLFTLPCVALLPVLLMKRDPELLAGFAALFLYGIGTILWIVIYASLWNRSGIDLSASAVFNYQGVTATQFLFALCALAPPIILFIFFSFWWAIAILTVLGVVGLSLTATLTALVARHWHSSHRYAMADGFRDPS